VTPAQTPSNNGSVTQDAGHEGRWVWRHEREIPTDAAACKQVLDELLSRLQAADWPTHDVFGIHLALEEALMNAIKHGNRYDLSKRIQVACALADDCIRIEVADEGAGFDLASVPDCTDPERLEVCSGRGLLLMRSFMSRVEYNGTGNRVTMEKSRTVAV
jgi:serine/threonine-protein kinase RsbW